MYGSATSGTGPSERSLSNDDKSGLQSIYGVGVAPPSSDLDLTLSGTLTAGASVTMTVTGADPGVKLHLIQSTVGTGSVCPSVLLGYCLDLGAPIAKVTDRIATSWGSANFTITVPASYSGYNMGYQVVKVNPGSAPTLSNVVTGRVAASGGSSCPSGTTLDCAGACYDSSWIGDGACDDGTTYSWGSPDFDCSTFAFDDGDC